MKLRVVVFALAVVATPAFAGPPYLTDDPVPTDTGHWEIYAYTSGEGHGSIVDADAGFDINYGAVKDVQLTVTLPLSFTHAPLEGWRSGTGDLEAGVKYRFFDDENHGLSAAIFPRVILPTASHSPGEKTQFLLPLWAEKDFKGGTSLFGGDGYTINPGPANRNFWQAGIALTQAVSPGFSIGAEMTRQSPDAVGGTSQTRAGVGSTIHIKGPASLLVSGGPAWADHQTSYHFYAALGFDF